MTLYRRGRFYWSRFEIDGQLVQFSTKTTSKNVARRVEAAKRTAIAQGRAGLTSPTFETFFGTFLNTLPRRVSPQTFLFYTRHGQPLLHFNPLATCQLNRIDSNVLNAFVQHRRTAKNQQRKGGVSVTTINHNLRTLRRVLHVAEELGAMAKVPKIKLLPHENQRDYVISDADIGKFTARPGLISKIVPVLCDSGMRRGEAANLTWTNVNFEERFIQIARGKTRFARRKIPMTKLVFAILSGLREADATAEYVFTNDGRRITVGWLSHAFLKARQRLGLPAECVLHGLRHRFATVCANKGVDAFTLQRLLGWSNIQMAMRYVHPSASKLDQAVAMLDPEK